MKILRFIYDWPPPWLGLAPGPYEMTRAQSEMGHEVSVICGSRLGGSPAALPGVRILGVPQAIKGILVLSSAPALLIRYWTHRARHPVDVIHGHAQITQWFSLWRLFFGGRIPYFYHLHITFAGREASYREKGIKLRWNERINTWAGKLGDAWGCRAADHIFATNHTVKEEAVRLMGVDPGRITVVRNGVNTALFRPMAKSADLVATLGFSPGDRVLLYVGVFNERKNISLLLEALAKVPPDVKLILAGGGAPAHAAMLREKARNLGIENRVRWVGSIAYPDLPPYYSLCDLFVLPSLYEGFPKVLLEALACGKPALVHEGYSLDPDVERFVDKTDCTDSVGLAAALVSVLARGFKSDHGEFVEMFSWRNIMREIEGIYKHFIR